MSKQEQKYKNYDIKDGYAIQTKLFNWELVRSDYKRHEQLAKFCHTWEEEILVLLNEFALTVEVLDIMIINKFDSSYHNGTFSKTSETYSHTPQFLLIYQVPKEQSSPSNRKGISTQQIQQKGM